jgi:hypothetical protein
VANALAEEEARRDERREREREEQRREDRREELREQAREQERERQREEDRRLAAVEETRAEAAGEERKARRRAATLSRIRADRRAQQHARDVQDGRLAAAREAGDVVRRALAAAARATADRGAQARRQRLAEAADQRRVASADQEHAEQRRSGLAAGAVADRRQEAAQQDRTRERQDQRQDQRRDELRDQRRAEQRSDDRDASRREAAREDARADDRDAARREAARDRTRAEARDTARREAARDRSRADDRDAARRDAARDQAAADRQQAARAADRDAARADERDRARQDETGEARREQARAAQRDEARAAARREEARAGQRASARSDRRRETALAGLRDRTGASAGAALSALRVHGPLLLDEHDQPLRLRAAHVPGFDTAVRGRHGFPPALGESDLDLLARWGATAVSVPIALDLAMDVPAVADPLVRPVPPPVTPEPLGAPDEGYLEALETAIDAAAERGLYTVVQLARLRRPGDDRPVPFDALRRLWQLLGERLAGAPTVLFDLLRGPDVVDPFVIRPASPALADRQLRTITLALLGELRRVHPGAIVLAETAAGQAPVSPLTYTDGSAVPGVVLAYRMRSGTDRQVPPELLVLARRVPVAVTGWSADDGQTPGDALGRRLAAAGLHWVAEGWPEAARTAGDRPLAPTPAGRSLRTALAQPDVVVGDDARTGSAGPVRPVVPEVGGGGLGGRAGRLLVEMLLGAVPVAVAPPPLDLHLRSPISTYLPTPATLEIRLAGMSKVDRQAELAARLAQVLARWQAAEAAGAVATLDRAKAAETAARAALPAGPRSLPGALPTRLRLDLDLASPGPALGRSLVTGATTVSAAARTAHLCRQALMGLRQLDDVLARVEAARQAATATGAPLPLVLALYRTEGALALPPSADSIAAGLPSGTSAADTSLGDRPDLTNLVWLADAAPVAGWTDTRLQDWATRELILQVAGLDVLGGFPAGGVAYQGWTHATWKAAGVDNFGTVLARAMVLADAVAVRRHLPAAPLRPAVSAAVKTPVPFVATVISDGVQLLSTYRSDLAVLLGPGPHPPPAPTTVSWGIAYLRYNVGEDNLRLALASALLAASGTKGAARAALRTRIAADPALKAALKAALAAVDAATTDVQKAAAQAAVWPVVGPWCLTAGNLDALGTFVEEASPTEWRTWKVPRANVTRFRVLLAYYERLLAP